MLPRTRDPKPKASGREEMNFHKNQYWGFSRSSPRNPKINEPGDTSPPALTDLLRIVDLEDELEFNITSVLETVRTQTDQAVLKGLMIQDIEDLLSLVNTVMEVNEVK